MPHTGSGLASVLLLALLMAGCAGAFHSRRAAAPFPENLETLVVVGFRSALDRGTSPGVISSSISGDAFAAREVPRSGVVHMTDRLVERVSESGRYDIVSPSQAEGVMAGLMSARPAMSEIEIFNMTGRAFSADAVLVGYLYRWEEREGRDYAVKRPASVAFELYLIRPADGAVLWKDRFDMKQKSLSENLLEMETFLKGRGKWMTAEQLADLGLDRVLGNRSAPRAQPSAGTVP
jgi:hypothetical protein